VAVRIRLEGDRDTAKALLPTSRKFLVQLKNDMKYNDLKQNQRTIKMADGVVFKVKSIFGQDTIDITTHVEVVEDREE